MPIGHCAEVVHVGMHRMPIGVAPQPQPAAIPGHAPAHSADEVHARGIVAPPSPGGAPPSPGGIIASGGGAPPSPGDVGIASGAPLPSAGAAPPSPDGTHRCIRVSQTSGCAPPRGQSSVVLHPGTQIIPIGVEAQVHIDVPDGHAPPHWLLSAQARAEPIVDASPLGGPCIVGGVDGTSAPTTDVPAPPHACKPTTSAANTEPPTRDTQRRTIMKHLRVGAVPLRRRRAARVAQRRRARRIARRADLAVSPRGIRNARRAGVAQRRATVAPMLRLRALWLVHPDADACEVIRRRFEGLPAVTVHAARFVDLPPHDAFVTAGNAYGIMTAGIDAAVVSRFGRDLMRRVQREIVGAWLGEQPVGTAFVIDSGDPWCPRLVHAPTMRIPGSIAGTDAVYRATWAAFVAMHRENARSERPIEVACLPAMGCGFGGVSFDESARQMAAAYRHALRPPTSLGDDWNLPLARERAITDRPTRD